MYKYRGKNLNVYEEKENQINIGCGGGNVKDTYEGAFSNIAPIKINSCLSSLILALIR